MDYIFEIQGNFLVVRKDGILVLNSRTKDLDFDILDDVLYLHNVAPSDSFLSINKSSFLLSETNYQTETEMRSFCSENLGNNSGGNGTPLTKTAVETLGFVDQSQTEQIAATAAANASLSTEAQQNLIDQAVQDSDTNLNSRLNIDVARKSEIPTATLPNANVTSGVVEGDTQNTPSNDGVFAEIQRSNLFDRYGTGWDNLNQLRPDTWSFPSNGGSYENGVVTFTSNGGFPSLRIVKSLETGKRYILVANIGNPRDISDRVLNLFVNNHTQSLYTVELNTNKKIHLHVFDANNDVGSLTIGIRAQNGGINTLPVGETLLKFDSDFIGFVEHTEEREVFWLDFAENFDKGLTTRSVFKSKIADGLTKGAEIPFQENSFDEIKPLFNQITGYNTEPLLVRWGSVSGTVSSDVRGVVVREGQDINGTNETAPNDQYIIKSSIDRSTSSRFWFGFRFNPNLYQSIDREFLIYVKGTISGQNIRDFQFRNANKQYTIIEDLQDGQTSSFESLVPVFFFAGTNDSSQYGYFYATTADENISIVEVDIRFDEISVYDNNDSLSINDYASATTTKLVIPKILPSTTATKDFVNNRLLELNKVNLKPSDLKFKYDIEAAWSHGQSLNVGGGAANQSTDYKNTVSFVGGSQLRNRPFTTQADKDTFFGNNFVLVEDNNSNEQYPPVVAATNSILSLIESENKVDIGLFGGAIMPFATGLSGGAIQTMNKGTQPYSFALEVISKAKEFATNEGKTFAVRALNFVQGEANSNDEEQVYYDLLSQFFIDFNTDVKSITGQEDDVQFITYQTSSWRGRVISSAAGATPITQMNVQNAQVRVANNFPNVHLCGAMYQFEYSDFFHPVDRGVVGIQQGIAYKRLINDESNWTTFQPISHTVINNGSGTWFIQLKFEAPVLPIRFDVTGRIHHNPRGKQPNFGFKVFNTGDVNIISEEPFIARGNTVVIPVNENPIGSVIWYAEDGHQGGGNLCDSQNITIVNKGIEYNVDNFCVSFDNYTVD